MSNIPIRYIVLEGTDCSGKTSLYSALHKETGFKHNIHDRSFLSMLCYARLYGRDESFHRDSLREEICDANNYLVVLIPPRNVILERLSRRGDEFQNETSIMKLYDIFEEEVEKISFLPNVLVVRSEDSVKEISKIVAKNISVYENFTPNLIGSLMRVWTKVSDSSEVQLRAKFNIPTGHSDPDVMFDPHEKEYYNDILNSCSNIIDAEMAGRNPYNLPQTLESRRFYYSSNSCISSIHFLPRDGKLKVLCTLRSTDSVRNGSIDLRFLAHLAAIIPKWHAWSPDEIQLEINYNSLHIRKDTV